MNTARLDVAHTCMIQACVYLKSIDWNISEVFQKSSNYDLVTQHDKAVETLIYSTIRSSFPDDTIIGEETGSHGHPSEYCWYIDPIDGTTNFIKQHRNFAVSIACYHDSKPIFGLVMDVMEQKLYCGIVGKGATCNGFPIAASPYEPLKSALIYIPLIHDLIPYDHSHPLNIQSFVHEACAIRSIGSIAIELCMLASGQCNGFLAFRSSPWDHNAARIIVNEAGGTLLDLKAQEIPTATSSSIIAANSKQLLQEMLTTLHDKGTRT